MSIDAMRYPWGHTEDDLVRLFTEFRAALDDASPGRRIPLTVRIPAGDTVFFRAFDGLVRAGAVQCVIPSWDTQAVRYSLQPYLKWKDHGCRVYGRIDPYRAGLWWDKITGFHSLLADPDHIKRDIARQLTEGADGIFVYQADQHLADPFTRLALKALNWKRVHNRWRRPM